MAFPDSDLVARASVVQASESAKSPRSRTRSCDPVDEPARSIRLGISRRRSSSLVTIRMCTSRYVSSAKVEQSLLFYGTVIQRQTLQVKSWFVRWKELSTRRSTIHSRVFTDGEDGTF